MGADMMINVQVYRYNPYRDAAPYMQSKSLPEEFRNQMVLDALEYLRERDPTLAYRRSFGNCPWYAPRGSIQWEQLESFDVN
jgi:succinate dehydrogenase/fumarate reductase-like Fe-S protein